MIEVKRLSKHFGHHPAVDNISFNVEKGEILGFLGPNGAGKSTTMRMITGFFPPTRGTVRIGGSDIITQSLAARRKIGYLPENAPVYPDMSVSRYLEFCAEIRGFSGAARSKRVDETVERCFLTTVRQQSVNTLSKGYKQRVCFAQSILHDPEYLILDEPTDGLANSFCGILLNHHGSMNPARIEHAVAIAIGYEHKSWRSGMDSA